jgi:hypothetical protein
MRVPRRITTVVVLIVGLAISSRAFEPNVVIQLEPGSIPGSARHHSRSANGGTHWRLCIPPPMTPGLRMTGIGNVLAMPVLTSVQLTAQTNPAD